MITISIITPAYNCREILSENIRSVFEQNRRDIEHIIVDNLSNDGTEEMVMDYRQKAGYPVVYIREPDTGIYNAMNKGIRAARGTWLHFLNSDDTYADSNVINDIFIPGVSQYDMICGGIFLGKSITDSRYLPSYYDDKNKYHGFRHQGCFIKKSFFDRHGLYDERFKIVADGIYNAKYYRYASYLIVEKPVAFMREGGASARSSWRVVWEYLIAMIFYRKHSTSHKISFSIRSLKNLLALTVKSFYAKPRRKEK